MKQEFTMKDQFMDLGFWYLDKKQKILALGPLESLLMVA